MGVDAGMSGRALWRHEPAWEWRTVELAYSVRFGKMIGDRELFCTVCGVTMAEHNARWPRRPRWVWSLFTGMGRFPDEAAEYPSQIRIGIGFGPGVWLLPHPDSALSKRIRGWRRVL